MKTETTTDTAQSNRLIAEFMGVTPQFNSYTNQYGLSKSPWWTVTGDTPEKVMQDATKNFKYDSDWNELMEVVDRIESLNENGYDVTIYADPQVSIHDWREDIEMVRVNKDNGVGSKIEAVHMAVTLFINKYNSYINIV